MILGDFDFTGVRFFTYAEIEEQSGGHDLNL